MRIKISENKYIEITSVEVVGDFYDGPDGGEKLGDGRNAIRLDAGQVESLGISNIQELADAFNGNNQNQETD